MARHAWALLAVLLLAVPGLARAADPEPLAGNWRVNLQTAEKPTYWLLKFESENGKWQGHVLDVAEGIPPSEIEDVSVSGDRLRFTLVMKGKRGTNTATFDGTFPKEAGKPIRGSLELDQLVP